MNFNSRPIMVLIAGVIVAALGWWMTAAGNRSSEVVYESSGPDWNWTGPSLPDQYIALLVDESDLQSAQRALPAQVWASTEDSLQEFLSRGESAVVVAYLGEAPTGGYAIRVRSVRVDTDDRPSVTVAIARRRPSPDEFVTQTVSYPYEMVPIQRNKLPEGPFSVRFVDMNGRPLESSEHGERGDKSP